MINIINKEKCSGCTACYSICPRQCIEMRSDLEGFLYPYVNYDKCINCGLCDKICPILNTPFLHNFEPSTIAFRVKNEQQLLESTSGGFFTAIAEYTLSNAGVICAATFEANFEVVHMLIASKNKYYEKCKGSKYVQSTLNNCFAQIKDKLNKGILVCFIGTTCQVGGLLNYLVKQYSNLITVDLVCHGVPSPELWRKYLVHIKNKYKADIVNINFRNKTYGYHSGTMKIEFENAKYYYGSARTDYMLKSFFSEISSRPSCYICAFKGVKKCSDLTLFDCWHGEVLVPGLVDDDKGYTNIIIQSQKGKDIIEKFKESYDIYETELSKAIELDGVMINGYPIKHNDREIFYQKLNEFLSLEGIEGLVKVSRLDMIIEVSKKWFHKLNLMGVMREIKKRIGRR